MEKYGEMKFNGYQSNNVPTIIFIAGSLVDPMIYERVKIPEGFQAIYLSWMEGTESRNIDFVAEKLAKFISVKKFPKLILAGYSSGGMIAMLTYLNLKDKQLISGILLSNTGCNTATQTNTTLPDIIKTAWTEEAISNFIKRCFSKPLDDETFAKLLLYAKQFPSEVALEPVVSLRKLDVSDKLSQVICPVIIAHGELDPVRPINHAETLKSLIKNSEIIFLNAGHSPMYEDSENYTKALEKLVKKIFSKEA